MKRSLLVAAIGVSLLGVSVKADSVAVSYNADLAAPGYYAGNGPVNGGFTIANDTTSGIELGLRAQNRFTGPIHSPTSTYFVTGGLDPTQLALTPPKIRATWNYDYSINLQGGSFTLADFTGPTPTLTALLSITDITDPLHATASYNPLDAALGDNTSGSIGAQNSENLGFDFALGTAYFQSHASDTYEFTLSVSKGAQFLASDTIDVAAIGTPLPASVWQGAVLLGGMGLFAAGKRRKPMSAF